jgi:uncharacterized protein YndB with AHSA1/START domain
MANAVTHASFSLRRRIPAPASAVFRAFADPELKRRWYAEGEQHEVEEFSVDLREGAVERLRYRFRDGTQFAGLGIANTDTVMSVAPDEHIVWASKMAFSGANISAALITAELLPVDDVTELVLTFQGAFFEGADGPQIRKMGWQVQLDRMAGLFA